MSQRVGLVLAGGRGRRLGRSKGDLEVAGRTLASRAAELLWPFCGSVLVSVSPGAPNPAPDHAAVEDDPPSGRGPLAGIDAAFRVSGDADLLVLACDYPRFEAALLQGIVDRREADDDLVILTDSKGRDHPLAGLWSRRTAPLVAQAVEQERLKVRSLLADFTVRRLGPESFPGIELDRALFNLNWPDELGSLA